MRTKELQRYERLLVEKRQEVRELVQIPRDEAEVVL